MKTTTTVFLVMTAMLTARVSQADIIVHGSSTAYTTTDKDWITKEESHR